MIQIEIYREKRYERKRKRETHKYRLRKETEAFERVLLHNGGF